MIAELNRHTRSFVIVLAFILTILPPVFAQQPVVNPNIGGLLDSSDTWADFRVDTQGASGGTGIGYTTTGYIGTTANFTPNAANQVAQRFTINNGGYWSFLGVGLAANTNYYFKLRTTDSGGNFGDSQAISFSTTGLASGTAGVGTLGDSIIRGDTGGGHLSTQIGQALVAQGVYSSVAIVNGGWDGTNTISWQPNADSNNQYYSRFKAMLNAQSVTAPIRSINVQLGPNDVSGLSSKADYKNNLLSLTAQLHTDFPDALIWLNEPTYRNDYTGSEQTERSARLYEYRDALDEIAAEKYLITPILRGSKGILDRGQTLVQSGTFQTRYPDNVHPNYDEATDLAQQIAAAQVSPTPEPSTLLLITVVALVLSVAACRKRTAQRT